MKENKNIDRLFQEKFKDFEAQPSNKVWSRIAASQEKEKDRKIIPIWWKLGGIAAGLIILFTLGSIFLNSENTVTNSIVNQESLDEKNKGIKPLPSSNQNEKVLVQNPSSTITKVNSSSIPTKKEDPLQRSNNASETNRNLIATSSQQNATQQQNSNVLTSINNKENSFSNKKTNSQITNAHNDIAHNDSSQSKDKSFVKQNTIANSSPRKDNTVVNNTIDGKNTSIASSDNDNKKDLTVEAQKIEELKDEKEAIVQTDINKGSKWNVGAVAAPVYYGEFGGSGVDRQFSDNSKTGDVNLSYGVQVSYNVTPKLKLRTGVSTVDLSYSTNGISFSTSGQGRSLSSVNFANDVETLVISDAGRQELLESFIGEPTGVTGTGSLEQRFNYIEIPMEAVYTISDKRIGLSLIGGISTLLLNDNQILLSSEEVTTTLGTSNAVNDVSFSTNIGIGIDYKMTDKLQLNLEPSFKYQVNGFNSDVIDFNPYYLGVYTGVSYKF